jgi:hypothetical protein
MQLKIFDLLCEGLYSSLVSCKYATCSAQNNMHDAKIYEYTKLEHVEHVGAKCSGNCRVLKSIYEHLKAESGRFKNTLIEISSQFIFYFLGNFFKANVKIIIETSALVFVSLQLM